MRKYKIKVRSVFGRCLSSVEFRASHFLNSRLIGESGCWLRAALHAQGLRGDFNDEEVRERDRQTDR